MINGDHGTTTSAEDKDAKRKSAFRYTSENSLEISRPVALTWNGRPVVALDIANRFYQLYYITPEGHEVNRQIAAFEVEKVLESFGCPLFVGFEDCAGSAELAERLESAGHVCRRFKATYTRNFNTGNKDDEGDARAIYRAMAIVDRESMKRDAPARALGYMLNSSELLRREARRCTQNLVARLQDENLIIGDGIGMSVLLIAVTDHLKILRPKLPDALWQIYTARCFSELLLIYSLHLRAMETDEDIENYLSSDDTYRRLMTVPCIGPGIAARLVCLVGDSANLPENARALAAYCGLVPWHSGTGGKITMGGLSLRGDPVLKSHLYEAVTAYINRYRKSSLYIERLVAKKGHKRAVFVIANHVMRVAWHALGEKDFVFDQSKSCLEAPSKTGLAKLSRYRSARQKLLKAISGAVKTIENEIESDEIEVKIRKQISGIIDELRLEYGNINGVVDL